MDKQEIEKRIKLRRSFVVKFGDEEGVDEDYASDQELKKPQPPLAKAPMTDRIFDLPTDFSGLSIDGDFLHIINSRKSHRSIPRSLCPCWSCPICSGAPRA